MVLGDVSPECESRARNHHVVIKQVFDASVMLKISVAGTLYNTAGNSSMGNVSSKYLTV